MIHENVDKDPDSRKSSNLEPINRSLVPWILAVLGGVIGIVLAVVAGLLGFKLFGWITGDGGNDAKAASAGAWASGFVPRPLPSRQFGWLYRPMGRHGRLNSERKKKLPSQLRGTENRWTKRRSATRQMSPASRRSPAIDCMRRFASARTTPFKQSSLL